MSDDVGMEELHSLITGEKEAEAANQYRTIPSGDYRLQVTNYRVSRDSREAFPSGDPNPNYGRVMVDLTIECYQEGERKGVVFVTVSPEKKLTKEGYPDRFWAPWCSLVIALGQGGQSAATVLEAAKAYPIEGRVSERFTVDDVEPTQYVTVAPGDVEKAAELRGKGYQAKNVVRKFKAIK